MTESETIYRLTPLGKLTLANELQRRIRMTHHINRRPEPWQLDPKEITAELISYFCGGKRRTTEMPLMHARSLIADGKAYAISPDTIGALDKDGNLA